MEEMLDVTKILKDIRMTRILVEHSLVNEKIMRQIEHTENHLIDLEEGLSDSLDFDDKSSLEF